MTTPAMKEPIGGFARAMLPRGKRGADRKPRQYAETNIRPLEPSQLREWLRLLALTPPMVARLLGRSEAVVYMWLAGEHRIPAYVTVWVEMLAAWDRMTREWVPQNHRDALVLDFIREQPRGSDMPVERIAQRMGWPVTIVRESVARLTAEGVLA